MMEWRAIPGYELAYEISDQGDVRSLDRVSIRKNGMPLAVRGRTLKPSVGNHGYYVVNLSLPSGVIQATIHSLMGLAFLGKRPFGNDVCHGDSDKLNKLGNLRYGTRLENVIDAQNAGTFIFGERVGNSKLKESEVIEIKARIEAGDRVTDIAADFDVSHTSIIGIRKGNRWGYLNE